MVAEHASGHPAIYTHTHGALRKCLMQLAEHWVISWQSLQIVCPKHLVVYVCTNLAVVLQYMSSQLPAMYCAFAV